MAIEDVSDNTEQDWPALMSTASRCLILLLSLIPVPASAAVPATQEAVVADGFRKMIPLGPFIQLLEDPDHSLGPEEVSGSSDFHSNDEGVPNLGYTSSTWWVRFSVRNPSGLEVQRFLEFDYPNVDHLTLFHVTEGQTNWDSCVTGGLMPFGTREVPHSSFVFRLTIPPWSTERCLLRIRTDSSLPLPLKLWTEQEFYFHQSTMMTVEGIFYGIMLLMLVFGLLMLPSLNDRAHVHYLLLILLLTLFQLAYSGMGAMLIWPGHPWMNPAINILTMDVAGIISLLFAMVFFRTRLELPVLHRIMLADAAVFGLIMMIYAIFGYAAAIIPTIYAVLATALLYVITGLLSIRKRRKLALYFLSAWLIFFAGAAISLSVRLGNIPVNPLSEHAYQIGIVVFVLLLAHANTRRIRQLGRLEQEARREASEALMERDDLIRSQNELLAGKIEERTMELTRVNEDLRAREEELKLILDNSPIGVCTNDLSGRYLSVNKAYCEMLGYSEEELTERSIEDVTHEEFIDENLTLFRRLASGEIDHYELEKKNLRRDGTELDIFLRAQLVRDSAGVPSFVIAVIENISLEKRALRKLQDSEEQYRSIFNAAVDAFLVFDLNGNIVEANPGACRTYGYSRDEFIGLHGSDIVSWEYYFLFEEFLSDASRGEIFTAESMDVRKDGTRIRIRTKGSRFTFRGEPHLLAVIRDITEETRLREQLERAGKMEALGSLAGGVAHDLNNILSGIVSYPDLMLLDLPEDSPIRKDIIAIRESGRKAAAVVQDLLTMARREVSRMEVLSPGKLMDDFTGSLEFRNLWQNHPEIDVNVIRKKHLGHIRGSGVHIEKALMNLVMNSVEAMKEGGNLTVSAERVELKETLEGYQRVPQGDYFRATVIDTGTGIDPDELGKVFEPFFTKKKMGRSGTGLGMTVVWGTMRDHGGYIDLRSDPESGTTVQLYFPITQAAPAVDPEDTPLSERMGSGERILIVDDSDEQLEISSAIMEAMGYEALTATSGEEAVSRLEKESVDLVILDMVMDPGMDGLDTLRKIQEFRPDQRAIIVTGFAETDRVRQALELGAGRCVPKPYSLTALAAAVREELDRE